MRGGLSDASFNMFLPMRWLPVLVCMSAHRASAFTTQLASACWRDVSSQVPGLQPKNHRRPAIGAVLPRPEQTTEISHAAPGTMALETSPLASAVNSILPTWFTANAATVSSLAASALCRHRSVSHSADTAASSKPSGQTREKRKQHKKELKSSAMHRYIDYSIMGRSIC